MKKNLPDVLVTSVADIIKGDIVTRGTEAHFNEDQEEIPLDLCGGRNIRLMLLPPRYFQKWRKKVLIKVVTIKRSYLFQLSQSAIASKILKI